jgi:hypothetical protein
MTAETKITVQKSGQLNDNDRLLLAQLLIKAGYTVRIGKEKRDGSKTATIFVGYRAD